MKKILSVLLIALLFAGILVACAETPEPETYVGISEPEETTSFPPVGSVLGGLLDYARFLDLLEANGFSFEETGGEGSGLLSVVPKAVSLGGEFLVIYEYDSKMAMELESSFVSRSGSLIELPPNEDGYGVATNVTWASYPHWFKKDLIIVLYVGEDRQIIEFLAENLTFFAGWRAP